MSRRPGDLNNLLPTGTEAVILFLVVTLAYIASIAIKYWYVILAIVTFLLLLWGLMCAIEAHDNRKADKARRKANIIARAESQHARLMDGDDSALYGDYPPADL